MTRPVVFGYLRIGRTQADLDRRTVGTRQVLGNFAEREGFALAQLFQESSRGPALAMEAMIEAARFSVVTAIIVPSLWHLGDDDLQQRNALKRLEGVGLPVFAASVTP